MSFRTRALARAVNTCKGVQWMRRMVQWIHGMGKGSKTKVVDFTQLRRQLLLRYFHRKLSRETNTLSWLDIFFATGARRLQ